MPSISSAAVEMQPRWTTASRGDIDETVLITVVGQSRAPTSFGRSPRRIIVRDWFSAQRGGNSYGASMPSAASTASASVVLRCFGLLTTPDVPSLLQMALLKALAAAA